MAYKDAARQAFMRATGLYIDRSPPRGKDYYLDIRKALLEQHCG